MNNNKFIKHAPKSVMLSTSALLLTQPAISATETHQQTHPGL